MLCFDGLVSMQGCRAAGFSAALCKALEEEPPALSAQHLKCVWGRLVFCAFVVLVSMWRGSAVLCCARHSSRSRMRSARSTSGEDGDACCFMLAYVVSLWVGNAAGFSAALRRALEEEPPALSAQHLRCVWGLYGVLCFCGFVSMRGGRAAGFSAALCKALEEEPPALSAQHLK